METIFLRFKHGYGDCCQFAILVKHLQVIYPEAQITIACPEGAEAFFNGLPNVKADPSKLYPVRPWGYTHYWDVHWPIPDRCYWYAPSTKVTKTLIEQFRLEPIPSLYHYEITISPDVQARVDKYLETIPRPFVVCHWEGSSQADFKNLEPNESKAIVEGLLDRGLTPLILDWGRKSPYIDQAKVFCPYELWGKHTDVAVVAALIKRAWLMIGIDSGPLHIAGAVPETLALGLWTFYAPVHNYDFAPNVYHLIPHWTARLIEPENREEGLAYMAEHYQGTIYEDLVTELLDCIDEILEQ